ncbi:unnamed protein product [Auanema sp. JU1783]|nr:unnamed protein product [Auanema sp. JU1783]
MESSVGRSLISLAKRGIARAHRRLSHLAHKVHGGSNDVALDEPILEAIFANLDLEERIRMGLLSRQAIRIVDRMPIILPFLMIRSDGRNNIEIVSDNMELLAGHVLEKCDGYSMTGNKVFVENDAFPNVLNQILTRISGVSQFWLDSTDNGSIAQIITDYYRKLNENKCFKRLQIEQLTVVGTGKSFEMDPISSLIMLARKNLQAIRFRHCRLQNEEESQRLWSAIGQCPSLQQIQYEPCKLDKWSRPYIASALEGKKLVSLILTGVAGLKPADLFRYSSGGCLQELAVVGEHLPATIYADPKAKKTVEGLNSLLIQIEDTFSLEDIQSRNELLQVLNTLPNSGVLEVIHSNRGSVSELARLLSYWLHLTRDSGRCIKLKLEECSQERQDAAVGRLMRKSKDTKKSGCSNHSLTLTCGEGSVILLDKNTWFGDEL